MTAGCHGCHGCRHKENPYARAQVSLLYHGNCGNHGNCAMTGTLPSLVKRLTDVTSQHPHEPDASLLAAGARTDTAQGLGQSGIGCDHFGRTLRSV